MPKEQPASIARRRSVETITREFRGIGLFLFLTSGLINILALTGAFYMLQIYDRALTSGSIPTLVALSVLAIGLYLFQGVFDVIRSQVLVRVGARLDKRLAPLAHQVAVDMPRYGFSNAESLERGRDVDVVRTFLGSQGPMALFDLPWVPIYLAFAYFLHPMLGALTFGGAFVLALMTVAAELMLRRLSSHAQQSGVSRGAIADSNARNSEILKAMGFADKAVLRFEKANGEHLALQTRSSDINGTFGAISRVLRMLLQSAILGLGAYLTIIGELSAGAIIASSIASSRALAPIDLAITNWKGVVSARHSFRRLVDTVTALNETPKPMILPTPKSILTVDKITVVAPSSGRILLSDVAFELKAGQALGVIGPSASGKTTFVRALTGVWPVLRGSVRLDGAEMGQWEDAAVGKFIGYLPQDVSLLDATIEENISRYADEPDPMGVISAARAAGVHDMIVHLPEGYHTHIGPSGMVLSAGQRQRIGLARALYNDPFLVVMDEPNSNLDGEGETALTEAIRGIRARGGIAIIIAHRPSALAAVDLVAVVQNGKMVAFGPKSEILAPQPVGGRPSVQPTAANNAREGAMS